MIRAVIVFTGLILVVAVGVLIWADRLMNKREPGDTQGMQ